MPIPNCPISNAEFMQKAEPLKITVNGNELIASPKTFSSGSFGWHLSGKVPAEVDGKQLAVQVGCNLVVVGSKGR